MKEYEYSFKVSNLTPCFEYCEKNGYELLFKNKQIRTLYKNSTGIMARITIDEVNGKTVKTLDFKEDKIDDNVLKIREESEPVQFENDSEILEKLSNLNYKKGQTFVRTRTVYKKDDVTFEIDEYEQPMQSKVIAIEGKKEPVDKAYKDMKGIYGNKTLEKF